jgi:hypothetical protein
MQAFLFSFLGRLAATLFTAICVALGFGPDRWAKMVIGTDPVWWIRGIFIAAAIGTAAYLVLPSLIARWRPRDPDRADWPVRRAVEYVARNSAWGYRALARLNYIEAVEHLAQNEICRLAGDKTIDIYGRPPNVLSSVKIDPNYWQHARFKDNISETQIIQDGSVYPPLIAYSHVTIPGSMVESAWPRASILTKAYYWNLWRIKLLWIYRPTRGPFKSAYLLFVLMVALLVAFFWPVKGLHEVAQSNAPNTTNSPAIPAPPASGWNMKNIRSNENGHNGITFPCASPPSSMDNIETNRNRNDGIACTEAPDKKNSPPVNELVPLV